MSAQFDFRFNPNVQVAINAVGASRQPVLVADDVLRSPQSIVDFAATQAHFAAAWTPQGGYPGVRAEAPRDYVRELLGHLDPVIQQAFFPSQRVVPGHANCLLSMVTRRPGQLTGQQRVPHFDTPDPMRIAFLHYFCDEHFGGTAFYRHRKTRLDAVTPELETEFCRLRDAELEAAPPPEGFITADAPDYERTATIDARFNRLIVYRSQHLHSGAIPADMNFSENPREGRLTATIFITYRPAQPV